MTTYLVLAVAGATIAAAVLAALWLSQRSAAAGLRVQIDEAQGRLNVLTTNLDAVRARESDLAGQLATARTQLAEAQGHLAKYAPISDLEGEVAKVRATLDSAITERDHFNAED